MFVLSLQGKSSVTDTKLFVQLRMAVNSQCFSLHFLNALTAGECCHCDLRRAGQQTQGFGNARQARYQMSYAPGSLALLSVVLEVGPRPLATLGRCCAPPSSIVSWLLFLTPT